MNTKTKMDPTIPEKKMECFESEKAIQFIKQYFSNLLSESLQLQKIAAPLLVQQSTGLNDNLSGLEKAVKVQVKGLEKKDAVVVHSLAKWKREKLARYDIEKDSGIYTDMQALRQDEDLSDIHSVFVDQWDWEVHLNANERSIATLKSKVRIIYKCIRKTEQSLKTIYPYLNTILPLDIFFIHAEELLQKYPELNPKERENEIAKIKGAVFIIGIGGLLSNGEVHDGRAPDYDDWSSIDSLTGLRGLNGDILVWNPILQVAFEISSMGIRVDQESLQMQLKLTGHLDRLKLPFHKQIMDGNCVQSIGGGIGQSRLCMFLLKKRHIGEVQASVWPEHIISETTGQKINLL